MKKIFLILTATVLISAAAFAQNSHTLNLKKGQKFVVENKIVTTSSTEMQGQSMEANADVISTYNIEVKEAGDNNYNLTSTVSSIKMNMSQMGQEMTFDSNKPEDADGPIGATLKDYINQPKGVVIDRSGKVIPEKSSDSASEQNALIKQLSDFEATGYGSNLAFEALPKNLKKGSTWTNKSDENGISKSTTYTVTSIDGDIATIAITGTIVTDAKMENQGMELTTKTTGKFTGEEKVDIKTGVIQSNTTNVDASGTIGVMGQELPTSSKVTSTTTVKLM